MYIAVVGLFSNLILHISGFFSSIPPAQAAQVARYLNLVMFAVSVVSIVTANRVCENYLPRDYWKAALRGCPQWLKYLPAFLLAYAILFATIHGSSGVLGSAPKVQEGCAFGMAIYAISLAILYSALQVQDVNRVGKCLNGHQVPADAKFCEECGAQVSASIGPVKPEDTRSA
jgi:hypothetical protein